MSTRWPHRTPQASGYRLGPRHELSADRGGLAQGWGRQDTTTLNPGHTFAMHRGDRVVALDGNPDAGPLGYRVPRETTNTITNLLVSRREVARYADIRAFTSQSPTRLEVIVADDDPRITDALKKGDYRHVVELLETHYNLICMDTGTGQRGPARCLS